MILSIICSCLAVVQLSLGIVAAVNDSPQTRNGIILNYEQKYIYPRKNSPFDYYCTGPNYMYLFTWVRLLIMGVMQCNVNLRKLLSAHKSHVRETNFFTAAIPNQVRNSQTSSFVSVPGQTPGG